MTAPIPINLAVEDQLSEALLRKMLQQSNVDYALGTTYTRGGQGYLRKMAAAFNNASKGMPCLLLTDLDDKPCPPALITEWLTQPRHPNFLLRVAVRECEAWILADRGSFARFLGVREVLIPQDVDALPDPKAALIDITRRSLRRALRSDIVPRQGSTSTIGPNYNGRLTRFVEEYWQVSSARQASPSLDRTMRTIETFRPVWRDEQ